MYLYENWFGKIFLNYLIYVFMKIYEKGCINILLNGNGRI